jgi:hypothetical protein
MKNIISFFVCVFLFSNLLHAQLQRLNPTVQRSNSSQLINPWAGGLNNPQFSEVDMNNDLKI